MPAAAILLPAKPQQMLHTEDCRKSSAFIPASEKIFDFTYQTAFDNGLIEHEFDHVFTGVYEQRINPNPEEVKDVCYKSLDDIQQSLQTHPQKYTSWFHIAFPKVKEWAVQQGLVQPTI